MNVRIRVPADIAGCLDVLKNVHEIDGYPAVWPNDPAAFLDPQVLLRAWIALDGTAIVGHIALGAPEVATGPPSEAQPLAPAIERAEVKRFFVGPTMRGTGVASALLDVAVRHARARRFLPVLEVTTNGIAAITLYERLGWRWTGTKIATWSDASGKRPLLYTYELPS